MTDRKNWLPSVSTCWADLSEDTFRALTQVGIRHIELSGGKLDFWKTIDFVHTAKGLQAQLRTYGITIGSLHLPFAPFETLDPTLPDAAQRTKIVQIQTQILYAAAEIGIPIAVIHPSGEPYRMAERGERLRCALDTLAQIGEKAAQYGIRLAVENLPRTCLGNTYEEMRLILDKIPTLSVCFDTNHSLRQPNPECIRALGSKIITLHVSDYDMVDERHLLPFLGRNDWRAIMTELENADYNGLFTFEVPSKGVLTAENLQLAYQRLMEMDRYA